MLRQFSRQGGRGARFAVFAYEGDRNAASGVTVPAPFDDVDAFKAAFRYDEKRQALSYDAEQLSESFGLHAAALVETDASGIARTADGALLETIRFPMAKVTSACVGEGCVFVTTGNLPKSDAEYAATKAGGVFVLRKEYQSNGTF